MNPQNLAYDAVLRAEAEFADRDYAPHADNVDINRGMFRRYTHPTDLSDWRQMSAVLLGELDGVDLLDLACGMGEESVYFAKLGARVTGVDVSEVGIASLRKRAAHHGLAIRALQMRVDPTELPGESFDLIHGLGILHHVGIAAGLAEARRLLRPSGVAVFLEPLGDSRAIERVKTWLVQNARFLGRFDEVTEHERNLSWQEIDAETRQFSSAWVYPYHLLYRLKRLLPDRALVPARRIDHGLLTALPPLRRWAGAVVIRIRK